ncbi:neuronatin-like [Arvicanthis niloticus]|uniref:neuronatin-like n=1 Tax=Arvicanthis niloticus TaxID=61156 RepID=UPI00402B84EF
MAAVAAASAELLIIGWYIFRVLLQPLPNPSYGSLCTKVPLVLFVPARSRAHILAQTLSPVRPRQPGTKTQGCGGRPLRTITTSAVFLECCIYWVGFAFRNPPGTQLIARSEVFRYSLQKLAHTVSS